MTVVYNEDVPSYAMVKRQAADFCRGRSSLEVEHWLAYLSKAVCEENCRAIENIVFENRQGNCAAAIADTISINVHSAKTIFGEHC